MTKNTKKRVQAIVCIAMLAVIAVFGTVAYLTDTESEINVMTVGKVDIELIEQQRNEDGTALEEFRDGKELLPINGSAQGEKDEWGLPTAQNYVDKIVTIENTGKNDAYLRVWVAVPSALDNANDAGKNALHWNTGESFINNEAPHDFTWAFYNVVNIDDVAYNVYTFNYAGTLAKGATTDAVIIGFYLDDGIDYDDVNKTYTLNGDAINYDLSKGVKIPVFAQAVQAGGFANATDAFATAELGCPWEDGATLGESIVEVGTAAELQAALDNAVDGVLIKLTDDIAGDVTVTQKPDVKVTVLGDGHTFDGVLLVDGKSATYTTAGLTVKDINFKADSISADACIQLGNGTNATRYTCNVTVENCTFDVPGAVGVKSYTSGDKNLIIRNCTATANAHSLVQAKGIDGILVEKCTVNSKNGLNFNNSDNVTVLGCTVDVKGYAVRFGESSGGFGSAETYLIKDCSLKSANDDGDATIILRGTADNSTLTIVNTTISGIPDIANTATNVNIVQ